MEVKKMGRNWYIPVLTAASAETKAELQKKREQEEQKKRDREKLVGICLREASSVLLDPDAELTEFQRAIVNAFGN